MKYLVLIIFLSNSLMFAWLKISTQPRPPRLEIAHNLLSQMEDVYCQGRRSQEAANVLSLNCFWTDNDSYIRIVVQWYATTQTAQKTFYRSNFGGGKFHGYPVDYQRDTEFNNPQQTEFTEIQAMEWQAEHWIVQVSTVNVVQNMNGIQQKPRTPSRNDLAEFIYVYLRNSGEFISTMK